LLEGNSIDSTIITKEVTNNISEINNIIEDKDSGFIKKLFSLTDFLVDLTTIAPLSILFLTIPFYALRRFFIKSKKMSSKIKDIELYLFNVAQWVGKKSFFNIYVKEAAMKKYNIHAEKGAIVNVAKYMNYVTNTVNQNLEKSNASDELKSLVKQLTKQIEEVSESIDIKKTEQMGSGLETLTKEISIQEPRKEWYHLSLKGIKEAAEAVGSIGKPIIETVTKLLVNL
jgi:hypothetical protein